MDAKTKKQGGLVVSRKEGETVLVNGPVLITVSRIDGCRVRLHLVADRMTTILRGELAEKARSSK